MAVLQPMHDSRLNFVMFFSVFFPRRRNLSVSHDAASVSAAAQ
jgi:hypothetical protein